MHCDAGKITDEKIEISLEHEHGVDQGSAVGLSAGNWAKEASRF